jgi:hypothetical protein
LNSLAVIFAGGKFAREIRQRQFCVHTLHENKNFPCGCRRDRLPWFWFFFTVAVLLLSAMDRYHIVSQFKQRQRVVIIDPAGTYWKPFT